MLIDRASQCRGLQHGRSANLEEAALRPVQRKKKERIASPYIEAHLNVTKKDAIQNLNHVLFHSVTHSILSPVEFFIHGAN